jgi:hypothetical protein
MPYTETVNRTYYRLGIPGDKAHVDAIHYHAQRDRRPDRVMYSWFREYNGVITRQPDMLKSEFETRYSAEPIPEPAEARRRKTTDPKYKVNGWAVVSRG